MSIEANKAALRRFYAEVFNGGNLDLIDELFAPEYVNHGRPPGTRAALHEHVREVREAFPDVRFTLEDVIAEGEQVVARVTMEGTDLGGRFGPPTGRRIRVSAILWRRLEGGRFVEAWEVSDNLGLRRQLGLLPEGRVGSA